MKILDLLSADRNNQAACDNQQAPNNNGNRGFFCEGEPSNRLGNEEENRYVNAQQTPELPRWRLAGNVTIRSSDEKPVLTKPPPPALAVSRA